MNYTLAWLAPASRIELQSYQDPPWRRKFTCEDIITAYTQAPLVDIQSREVAFEAGCCSSLQQLSHYLADRLPCNRAIYT
jgi:hypothetical protein